MIERFTKRPEPVVTATVLTAVIGALVLTGMVIWRGVDASTAAAIATLIGIPAALLAEWARQNVTPLEDPRDVYGRALRPDESPVDPAP